MRALLADAVDALAVLAFRRVDVLDGHRQQQRLDERMAKIIFRLWLPLPWRFLRCNPRSEGSSERKRSGSDPGTAHD